MLAETILGHETALAHELAMFGESKSTRELERQIDALTLLEKAIKDDQEARQRFERHPQANYVVALFKSL